MTDIFDMDDEYQMAMYGELDDDDYIEEGDFGDDDFDDLEFMDDELEMLLYELEADDENLIAEAAAWEFTADAWDGHAHAYLDELLANMGNNTAHIDHSDEARDAAFMGIFAEKMAVNEAGDHDAAQQGWNDGWEDWCVTHMPGYGDGS